MISSPSCIQRTGAVFTSPYPIPSLIPTSFRLITSITIPARAVGEVDGMGMG